MISKYVSISSQSWDRQNFSPKISVSCISMLEKDGFVSKPKTIIFSAVFLVSHIFLVSLSACLLISPGVLMIKALLLFHIYFSPGPAQPELGTQPWQQTKNESSFVGVFFHLELFSDDLRTTGDTRGKLAGKFSLKLGNFE